MSRIEDDIKRRQLDFIFKRLQQLGKEIRYTPYLYTFSLDDGKTFIDVDKLKGVESYYEWVLTIKRRIYSADFYDTTILEIKGTSQVFSWLKDATSKEDLLNMIEAEIAIRAALSQ